MFNKLFLTTALVAATALAAPAIAGNYADKAEHAGEHEMADKNIVETATANEDFTTLVAAVQAADLVEALSGEGPFTVFAPTNAAFEKLPEGTVEDLLKPENKAQLQSLLKYHVVPGKIKAGDIATGETEVTTLEGTSADVVKNDTGVTIDGATVTKADIKTTNGVIHVIDTVIMP